METEITPNIDISPLSDYIGSGYEVYFIKNLKLTTVIYQVLGLRREHFFGGRWGEGGGGSG